MTRHILIIAPANAPVPNFAALAFQLKARGYRVELVHHYAQAFNRLVSLTRPLPSLIVLGHAPWQGFDGLELARQLKASAIMATIPLLFYSLDESPATVNAAYGIGASYYGVALKPPQDNIEDFVQSLIEFTDKRTATFYRMTFASPFYN